MSESSDRTDAPFERVLLYGEWWDCPRTGVCEVSGVLMNFECRFSDDLDDYPDEFVLWEATDAEVAERLALSKDFAEWRRRFDSGDQVARFEDTPEGRRARKLRPPEPPHDAQRAVPEWKLDRNRSFAERIPQHWVRWHFRA